MRSSEEPGVPSALSLERILETLPHRPPALLIERAPWVERDRALALTRPLALEPGPVPRRGDGAVPEPLIVEAVAQAAALAIAAGDESERTGALAAVPEFHFHAEAPAGARLAIHVALERRVGRLVAARGEAYAGGVLVAEGRVLIAAGPPFQLSAS